MADMKQIVRMLEEERRALLAQLNGIDEAIAALTSAAPARAPAAAKSQSIGEPSQPSGAPAPALVPRQVKAKRMLTEAHKQALSAGRRKARHAREVGTGIARELPADGFTPAIGKRSDAHAPRLIKRPTTK
jgi:hypothetical protein